MFAKLKQKIQDEQGELKFDFTKGLAVATATNQLNNFQPKFSQSGNFLITISIQYIVPRHRADGYSKVDKMPHFYFDHILHGDAVSSRSSYYRIVHTHLIVQIGGG